MAEQRIVIVTAASRGIGAACARELATRGYTVTLMARSEEVHDLARDLDGLGYVGSVTREEGKPIRHIDIWRGESTMPLTRISLKRGKTAAYRRAIMDNIYRAMRETFNGPEDDLFMTVSEHDDGNFLYGATYLGIARSDDLVIIQITAADTRTTDQKKALYRRIAERLAEDPGLRPEDVFISLVEVKRENWSFGLGDAQYA